MRSKILNHFYILIAAIYALSFLQAAEDPAAPAIKEGKLGERFMEMHEKFLARAKQGNIDLLFLGDSITEGWDKVPQTWGKYYTKYNAANFGIGGDRTQHVLWRIANGELDGISPKVIVLMIGTNNTADDSAEDIAKADIKIVQTIQQKLPQAKVLFLGIFPRGVKKKADDGPDRMEKIKQINLELAKLDDGKTIRYLDISNKFLDPDGKIQKEIMPDALHPNNKGYQIWADAMQPLLEEMMK